MMLYYLCWLSAEGTTQEEAGEANSADGDNTDDFQVSSRLLLSAGQFNWDGQLRKDNEGEQRWTNEKEKGQLDSEHDRTSKDEKSESTIRFQAVACLGSQADHSNSRDNQVIIKLSPH